MKIIKKIIFTFIIISMLAMAACQGEQPVGPTGPIFAPYIGGTNGVTMQFAEGMPPTTPGAILDSGRSSFSLGVKLANQGEHDINPSSGDGFLQLYLKGIKPEHFNLKKEDMKIVLEDDLQGGKKNIDGSIIDGQFTILSFDELSYQPDIQGDLPASFLIDMCYDYGTKSSTRICIADDVNKAITDTDSKRICEISSNQKTMNSAGPVQVTELRQSPMGGSKISVVFSIARLGTGDVFKYQSDKDCDTSLSNTDKDKINVHVYLPEQSNAIVSCSGLDNNGNGEAEGTIQVFKATPRTMTCSIEGEKGGDNIYMDTLFIDLEYRYSEQLTTSVTVKDIGSANN